MSNKYTIPLSSLAVLLVLSSGCHGASPGNQGGNTADTVSFLIDAVAKSNLTFIRNGEKHSSAEAASHIARKYDHYKAEIITPEDFIRLCASRSLLSGKPYLVQTAHGEVTAAEWLGQILAKYRLDRQVSKPPATPAPVPSPS